MTTSRPLDAAAPAAGVAYDGPIAGPESVDGWLSANVQRKLIAWFLVLGVAARGVRYFLGFPLWEDECFLCVNFIDRGFLELLGPLQYHQVAPPLFLWIELAAVRLLGFSEWTLRLFPFLCAAAGLFLFRRLAGRLLRGTAEVAAVATFAAAYPGIRYAAEAKQYSSDLFASLVLLCLAVEWWRNPAERRWLWGLAACVPVAVLLSYPAVFVAGGVSLFVGAVLWRTAANSGKPVIDPPTRFRPLRPLSTVHRPLLLGWFAYNALLLAGFGGTYLMAAQTQSDASLAVMDGFWHDTFLPWRTPSRLPGWLLATHTGDLLAYPVGGGRGASTLTFLGFGAGIGLLAWRRKWPLLLLGLSPFALQLVASALGRYPYGGHVKFSQHLAPAICVLTGLGATAWIGWFAARRPRLSRGLLAGAIAFPAIVVAASIGRDVCRPYKTQSDQRARAFARWFWFNAQSEGEAVCLKTDLGLDIAPEATEKLSWTAMYLCNQRIYSPRHANGEPPRFDKVSAGHPLRCVLYRDPKFEADEAALARWLADMQADYRLVGRETYPFPRYDKHERTLVTVDYLEEFKFVPRDGLPVERIGAADELEGAIR